MKGEYCSRISCFITTGGVFLFFTIIFYYDKKEGENGSLKGRKQ